MKSIRWGIIGCGDVTEVKSGPCYQKTQGFELVAVMRRNEEKAKDYAQRHSVPKYYTDGDKLITDPDIDAIYIATPPDSHMHYALKVAEVRKPCCIEKPMAPSHAESKLILEAFDKASTPLFVAYYRRSLPRFWKIQEWLKTRKIGDVRHISWFLSKPPSNADLSGNDNWRTDAKVAPGGYFDDLASHGLDLFAYLLGDYVEVEGISLNQQNLYSAKDAFAATWLHSGGVTGTGTWNFGCHHSEDRVEIFGSEGKIEFSIFEDNEVSLKNDHGEQNLLIAHPENVQQFHVERIKEHLFENKAHPSTGKTALHTSWVMDKILKPMTDNKSPL